MYVRNAGITYEAFVVYTCQVLLVNLEISLFFRLLASIYLFLVDAILLGYGACAH